MIDRTAYNETLNIAAEQKVEIKDLISRLQEIEKGL